MDETRTNTLPTMKTEEMVNLNKMNDSFEQIDLKIEKEGIMRKSDFYSTPNSSKISTPIREISITYKYKKLGNTYSFWYNKRGEPLFVIGPHWPFFLCLSTTITFICFLYFNYLWNYLNEYFVFSGMLIYLVQISSYLYTFLKNPGLPNFNFSPIDNERQHAYKFCQECKIFVDVEKNVNHCPDCNVCVEGYDHHCPWTSKCVGEGNLYGFYVFVFSTMFLFGYLIFGISIAGTH